MKKKYKNYRFAKTQEKVEKGGFGILYAMLIGATGVGKSSTLNTVFEQGITEVGEGTDPQTMEVDSYMFNDRIRFWDTPGLGDGVSQDKKHAKKIIDTLYIEYEYYNRPYGFIDMVLVIVDASVRDMGTVYHLINEILIPNIQADRILISLNKCDIAQSGKGWNYDTEQPKINLTRFLEEKVVSIQERVREATGMRIKKPVYFSSEFDYNVYAFLNFIIDNIPKERRKFL